MVHDGWYNFKCYLVITGNGVFILNLEVFMPCPCVSVANFEQIVPVGTDDFTNKASPKRYFLPFNFASTKICVAICLAEDGTRMGGI